ncbi:hypothetical protein ACFQY4_36670 [Catellatospora bangladeshensis]|uniref:hypothetical protein n=1 Tax=Catellatospora bangladeshensis TaxID=310355 RepID=UPI00361C23F3
MFELMFRHELLRGNQIGLREASRELFGVLVGLVGRARAGVPAPRPSSSPARCGPTCTASPSSGSGAACR